MPGSNPGRSCRPSRSDFSLVFPNTRINTGQDPLERSQGGTPLIGPGFTSGQLALNLQPNPSQRVYFFQRKAPFFRQCQIYLQSTNINFFHLKKSLFNILINAIFFFNSDKRFLSYTVFSHNPTTERCFRKCTINPSFSTILGPNNSQIKFNVKVF